MIERAGTGAQKAGLTNVEFHLATIDKVPLPDASVDCVISNCVINLAADKDRVFREAFRVLKPGGRLAVSDIVVRGDVPAVLRRSMELWVGCIAGALSFAEYERGLLDAGFVDVEIAPTHAAADGMHSAIVRARKPAR